MSATRSKAEVLRSLEEHRFGLGQGVDDASRAARDTVTAVRRIPGQWAEILTDVLPDQWVELYGRRGEVLDWRAFADSHERELRTGAAATGFVLAGGVALPKRRNKNTIVLGRKAMKVDRTSKKVGRAMAGLAAADTSMRRRRGRSLLKTGRLVVLLGAAGGGWAYVVTDASERERALENALENAGPRLEALADTVMDRVDEIKASGGARGLLSG